MMGFDTTDCTILRGVADGYDGLGNVVYRDALEQLSGVLVAPATAADLDAERLEGVSRAVYVHFPKEYGATLLGCKIRFDAGAYEGVWRVSGDALPYMPENTPGRWNRAALAVRVDG